MAVGSDDQQQDRGLGPITNMGSAAGSVGYGAGAQRRFACRPASCICRSARSGRRWAPIRSTQGFIAGIAGIGAVVLVMLVYYKRAASTRCWRWF